MVVAPAVSYMGQRRDVELIVASKEGHELKALAHFLDYNTKTPKVESEIEFRQVDVGDESQMNEGGKVREMIRGVDVVIRYGVFFSYHASN